MIEYTLTIPKKLESYKPVVAMTSNGVFRYNQNEILTSIEKIGALEGLVGLEEEKREGLYPRLNEKVPFKLYYEAVNFFNFFSQKGYESNATILYIKDMENFTSYVDKVEKDSEIEPKEKEFKSKFKLSDRLLIEGNFVLYIPYQKNSSTLTEFADDNFLKDLRTGNYGVIPYVELHSHHKMTAFWSSTDIANQQTSMFYGVVGNYSDKSYDDLFKGVLGSVEQTFKAEDIFNLPKALKKTTILMENDLEVFLNYQEVVEEIKLEQSHKGYVIDRPQLKEKLFPLSWLEVVTTDSKRNNVSLYKKYLNLAKDSVSDEEYEEISTYIKEVLLNVCVGKNLKDFSHFKCVKKFEKTKSNYRPSSKSNSTKGSSFLFSNDDSNSDFEPTYSNKEFNDVFEGIEIYDENESIYDNLLEDDDSLYGDEDWLDLDSKDSSDSINSDWGSVTKLNNNLNPLNLDSDEMNKRIKEQRKKLGLD